MPRMRFPGQTVAFLDIGTNAARLTIARFHGPNSWKIIGEHRIPTRLGEDMDARRRLSARAMRVTAAACARLAGLGRRAGAKRIVAVATAAAREAANRKRLTRLIKNKAGLTPQILTAPQEAALIFKGVAGQRPATGRVLVLEIGGGTTELIAGQGNEFRRSATLKLGAVRLPALYPFIAARPAVPIAVYESMVNDLKIETSKCLGPRRRRKLARPPAVALGSGGTIRNLAEIFYLHFRARKLRPGNRFALADLQRTIRYLCRRPLARRRKIAGIHPDRADIIIGGAAILEAIMAALKITSLEISFGGLRDGLIQNYPAKRRNCRKALSQAAAFRGR